MSDDGFKNRADGVARDALRVSAVNLSFGGNQVLQDLSLAVPAGGITAIIGPNGAGKSTLLNVINGLYQAQSGQITLFDHAPIDQAIQTRHARRIAELGVARTFQNLALFKTLSVRDNIRAGRHLREKSHWFAQWLGLPAARREKRCEEEVVQQILDELRLTLWADLPVCELSYGIQKRVELARALAAEPRLLLLDEPMAGMNVHEKAELAVDIRQIRDRFGTSIILIEHDVKVVFSLADHIVVLDYGRKIAEGDAETIRQHPEVLAAYLGRAKREQRQAEGVQA